MNSDPQRPTFDQEPSLTPPGPFAKLAAFLLGALFLVLAFMFSLVALAVVAVAGTLLWGWLWWKTRALRKQAQSGLGSETDVIEGEFVRHREEPRSKLPLQ